MLRSMYHNPFRRMGYYRRIVGALYAELKTGARRSSHQS